MIFFRQITTMLALILLSFGCIAAEQTIIALLSDDTESYQQPLKAFKEKIKQPVITYNLHGDIDQAPVIMEKILQHKPTLIFALGAKAAWFAKSSTKKRTDIKVIFAMVLNHQRYQLDDGQENIAGISSDIAPGTQLFNLSLFSPGISRVGIIYSPEHSGQSLGKAIEAAEILGLEIVKLPINRAKEFTRAWQKMVGSIDAFWVLNDPVIYTLDNIYWIKDRCIKEQLICIGQSDNISRLGVLLSINPDDNNIGIQAAAIARDILVQQRKPVEIGIQDPIGTHITLNTTTAHKIGLTVSDVARSMVNDIIKQ